LHRGFIILILLFVIGYGLSAQNSAQAPAGEFWQDSIKIGEEVSYSLSYSYPIDQKVIFPDSSYNFFPFDFSKKEYFPTKRLDSATLKDSVIYTLASFELDSIFYLRVPVFILEGADSLPYYSNTDSLYFKSVVDSIQTPPALTSNTQFSEVKTQFNYIYFSIGAAFVLLVLTVLAIIFGKTIYQKLKIYRLKRSYEKFEKEFAQLIASANGDVSRPITEHILNIWKNYLEKLEKRPITKFTTKEISVIYQNEDLKDTLKQLDRRLYGDIKPNNIHQLFGNLKQFSSDRLYHKIEEVKHG